MLGWVLFAVAAAAILGILRWLLSPGGKKWARKKQGQVWRRTGKVARGAWQARRMSTPRGRMRAERLKQPHRLSFGHRKPPGDDDGGDDGGGASAGRVATRVGAAVGSRWEAVRLAWVNRSRHGSFFTPGTMPTEPGSTGLCGSTKTLDGRPCRNPRMVGRDWCHEPSHRPWPWSFLAA